MSNPNEDPNKGKPLQKGLLELQTNDQASQLHPQDNRDIQGHPTSSGMQSSIERYESDASHSYSRDNFVCDDIPVRPAASLVQYVDTATPSPSNPSIISILFGPSESNFQTLVNTLSYNIPNNIRSQDVRGVVNPSDLSNYKNIVTAEGKRRRKVLGDVLRNNQWEMVLMQLGILSLENPKRENVTLSAPQSNNGEASEENRPIKTPEPGSQEAERVSTLQDNNEESGQESLLSKTPESGKKAGPKLRTYPGPQTKQSIMERTGQENPPTQLLMPETEAPPEVKENIGAEQSNSEEDGKQNLFSETPESVNKAGPELRTYPGPQTKQSIMGRTGQENPPTQLLMPEIEAPPEVKENTSAQQSDSEEDGKQNLFSETPAAENQAEPEAKGQKPVSNEVLYSRFSTCWKKLDNLIAEMKMVKDKMKVVHERAENIGRTSSEVTPLLKRPNPMPEHEDKADPAPAKDLPKKQMPQPQPPRNARKKK